MAYNGSGTFLINTAGQPVITGTTISSTTFNSLTADLATGLTTALTKDGQSTPTANIGMGAFKITNLAAGTVASDAARLDQVQGGAATFITVAGTDTLTGTTTPALAAYATGNQFSFVVANTNTGAVTINVDGIGAKAITRTGTTALVAGDMVAGQAIEIIYDGTRFQLVNGNSFTNLKVSGTLGVTGVSTFTAQPIVSSLTASLPVFTDASKGLVSNTMTGTGNVVMSTSPTLVTPALGTPSALVGTNITGTASGLTAGNVTTNANLTGVITSSGNATSIASQTGTGTTFAMSASPTFTGTVGAVGLTTTGNTILGDAATDTLNVGAGGLVKDASGNVGIGTATPVSKLNIVDASATVNVRLESGSVIGQYFASSTGGAVFLDTASSHPLVFRTNSTERMRIDTSGNLLLGSTSATGTGALRGSYGTGGITTNFAAGDGALNANTTGSQNVAVGVSALISNTTGTANLAVGYQALGSNVSGSNNLAMGQTALYYNTASNNTAVGYQAMQGASGTSTGANNSALGYQALYSNTTGAQNSAVGYTALVSNTSGAFNTAMGRQALYSNVTNSNCTAMGMQALFYNTADNNTAVGYQALLGASGTSTGTNNAAFGYQALYANTTGASNSAFGYQALLANTSGTGNTAIGVGALTANLIGTVNTALGYAAALSTTGSYNTIIGAYRGALTPVMTTGSNWTVLSDGQENVKLAIDTNSAIWAVNGQPFFNSPAPTAKTAAATLTGAELLTGIITYNGLAASLTMPLGSALDTAITGGNLPVGFAFEFVVINTGAATATMAVNTNVTFVGVLTVLALTSARWRVRKTAASTFIVYRVA